MGDNRIFNVNGSGDKMLLKTLRLVFMQWSSGRNATCEGYKVTLENGLILCWAVPEGSDIIPMPADLTADACLPIVLKWLWQAPEDIVLGRMCEDSDHDGHNTMGWQVYVEDWGHVGDERYAICAVRPAYIWHGK